MRVSGLLFASAMLAGLTACSGFPLWKNEYPPGDRGIALFKGWTASQREPWAHRA